MARRSSPLEDLLEGLFEFTDIFWQVGAVMTLVFFGGGLYSLIETMSYQPPTGSLTVLVKELGWMRYLIPATLFFLGFIFGIKTYSAYRRQNYY